MCDQPDITKLSKRVLADYIVSYEETIASLQSQASEDTLMTATQKNEAAQNIRVQQGSLDTLREEWVRRMEANWNKGAR